MGVDEFGWPFVVKKGYVDSLTAPGPGIELDEDAFCESWRLGSTSNQASAPVAHIRAATPNAAPQPKRVAIMGVSVAVTVLPICAPMFMTPETEPADSPAMSAVTDQ